MKSDPIVALEKIRELCNNPDTMKREMVFVLGQIEWYCRHALEDYDEPPPAKDKN